MIYALTRIRTLRWKWTVEPTTLATYLHRPNPEEEQTKTSNDCSLLYGHAA